MEVPAWVDRTIGTATIASSVEYDNLKRQYMMGLRIDGRTEESRSTTDENDVRQWMTTVKHLALFKTSMLERQPRILRARQCNGATDQRLDPVAVWQRHVRPGQVHLHPLDPPSATRLRRDKSLP